MILSNTCIYKFTIGALINGFIYANVYAEPVNAEKQLRKTAKEKACHILKTTQHQGDSVARFETAAVIATWCTTGSPGDKDAQYYILIAVKNSDHDWVDCPKLIPIAATHTPPFVSITQARINGKMENLDKFSYLSNDPTAATIPGPESETADGDGLNIGHWDALQTLYCYNDKWLISEFH